MASGGTVTQKIQHFLLVFDHSAGKLLQLQEFGTDADRALDAYAAKEREHEKSERVEIVLIGSASLDTVMLTHANYFNGSASVGSSPYLVGI